MLLLKIWLLIQKRKKIHSIWRKAWKTHSNGSRKNIDVVHDLILSDYRTVLKRIAEHLGILYERIHCIVHIDLRNEKDGMQDGFLNGWTRIRKTLVWKHHVQSLHHLKTIRKSRTEMLLWMWIWAHFYEPDIEQQSIEGKHSGFPRSKKFPS